MGDPKPKRPPFQLGKKADLSSMMYTSTSKTVAPKPAITLSRPSNSNTAAVRSNNRIRIGKNGLPIPKSNGVRRSLTPSRSVSRQASSEPREVVKNGKKPTRSSPVVSTTPQWGSEDDEDDERENEARRKRVRLEEPTIDKTRKIRDEGSFSETTAPYDIVHAADIANNQIQKHGRYQFAEYFTALQEDEEDCPTIELQYPCGNMAERYQLVKPTADTSDFRPLSEIVDNMRIVKDHYLDAVSADKVEPSELGGGGLVLKLERAAKDRQRAGAQQRFIDVVNDYNALLSAKRQDGTIATKLDRMTSPLPLALVQHLVKDQVYARTVSPHIDSVRAYEGFSDNVYGELLPKFLSRIFQETHLKSNQIFVDLGSGVGNCVLQAALEVGCESWGCEMMPNPAKLAEAQAQEFPSRCRMWGIKPGKVHLIQDDFTKNLEILEVLRRADVVLVNNQAFNPDLHDNLKSIFLELKEGCQVVSLKYFRDPAHRVKESNINDLVNCLTVVEKERFSGMVSWTDVPGKWYLHVKDSSELKAVKNRLEKSRRTT